LLALSPLLPLLFRIPKKNIHLFLSKKKNKNRITQTVGPTVRYAPTIREGRG
jgi:hypothetical protein